MLRKLILILIAPLTMAGVFHAKDGVVGNVDLAGVINNKLPKIH